MLRRQCRDIASEAAVFRGQGRDIASEAAAGRNSVSDPLTAGSFLLCLGSLYAGSRLTRLCILVPCTHTCSYRHLPRPLR